METNLVGIESRLSELVARVNPGAESVRLKLIENRQTASAQLERFKVIASLDPTYQSSLDELLGIISDIDTGIQLLKDTFSPTPANEEFLKQSQLDLLAIEQELNLLLDEITKPSSAGYNGVAAFKIRALACRTQSVLTTDVKNSKAISLLSDLDETRKLGSAQKDNGISCFFMLESTQRMSTSDWNALGQMCLDCGPAYDISLWLKNHVTAKVKDSDVLDREFLTNFLASLRASVRKLSIAFQTHVLKGSDLYVRALTENITGMTKISGLVIPGYPAPTAYDILDKQIEQIEALYTEALAKIAIARPVLTQISEPELREKTDFITNDFVPSVVTAKEIEAPEEENNTETAIMHHITMGKRAVILGGVPKGRQEIEALRKGMVLEKLTWPPRVENLHSNVIQNHIDMADIVFMIKLDKNGDNNMSSQQVSAIQRICKEKNKILVELNANYNLARIRKIFTDMSYSKFGNQAVAVSA